VIKSIVAGLNWVWQSDHVRKRLYHRWFVVLGMVAMLGALVSVPMTTSMVVAMAGPMAAAAAGEMPCHKPAKPCPDCPQKGCPEMGSCLVKCFQPLSPPIAEARLQGMVASSRVLPAASQVSAESLVPPLLRPPSV
jgi:hypothetical protein